MRRRKSKKATPSREQVMAKERKILKAERTASKKRMEAKKGYKMVNPVKKKQ